MTSLAPLIPDCLDSRYGLAKFVEHEVDAQGIAVLVATPAPELGASKKLRLAPFRGMFRSSRFKAKANIKTRPTKGGCVRQFSADDLALPVTPPPVPVRASSAQPRSRGSVNQPEKAAAYTERGALMPAEEPIVCAFSSLETEVPKRRPFPREARAQQEPIPVVAAPVVQAPPTPRLGLRPPWSAPASERGGSDDFDGDTTRIPTKGTESKGKLRPQLKISGIWGARRRRMVDIDAIVNAHSPICSRPQSVGGGGDASMRLGQREWMRSLTARPRPAGKGDHNLVHQSVLHSGEFAGSSTKYQKYGPQYVLARPKVWPQTREKGALLPGSLPKAGMEARNRVVRAARRPVDHLADTL